MSSGLLFKKQLKSPPITIFKLEYFFDKSSKCLIILLMSF